MNNRARATLQGSTAFRFVLVLGIANFFADMTYEGARSSTGPFLGTLGASAAVVGFTAGLGELLGYTLRSIFGVISDKTGKYWIITIVGYIINMLAVPALALAGSWPLATGLIVGGTNWPSDQETIHRGDAFLCRQTHRTTLGVRLKRSAR